MHEQLHRGVQGAEDEVVSDPHDKKPARPVAAPKHERAAENRQKPDQANPDNVIFKGALDFELGGVVRKSDYADYEK